MGPQGRGAGGQGQVGARLASSSCEEQIQGGLRAGLQRCNLMTTETVVCKGERLADYSGRGRGGAQEGADTVPGCWEAPLTVRSLPADSPCGAAGPGAGGPPSPGVLGGGGDTAR